MTRRVAFAWRQRWVHALAALVVMAVMATPSRPLAAQQLERPVPFDSAGRVVVVTSRLAERLQLSPPVWPVAPGFIEARLYAVTDSAWVLVVRRDSVVERYALDAAQTAALRRLIAEAAVANGMPVQGEGTADASKPAGAAFVAAQSVLGLTAYGLLAGIATESPVGYGAAAAGAFFLSQAIASDGNVSAPMAALSTDLALRSMVASSIVLGEGPFDDGMGYRTRSGLQLAAGLAGATTGFLWGRSLTLAEAEAIGWGSTTMGFTALGLASVAGGDAVERRSVAAAGMALGIPMGLWYARRAAYTLSAGDLYAMRVPQALGAAWGGVIGLATGASGPTRALWQTAGLALGTLVGDRTLAKPYNVTTAQAGLMVTGTAVSAILGSVLLANGGPRSDAEQLAYPTTVATLGAILTTALLDLKSGRRVASTGRATATRWSFDPAALLAAATRSPGQHALVRVAF